MGSTTALTNCVICLSSLKDTALFPCGHLCVCYECAVRIRFSPERNRCPLCRCHVEDCKKIVVETPKAKELVEPTSSSVFSDTDVAPEVVASVSANSARIDTDSCDVDELGNNTVQPSPSMDMVRSARLQRFDHQLASPASSETLAAVAEVQQVGEQLSSPSESKVQDALPPKCLKRLTRELRSLEEKREEYSQLHAVELKLRDTEGGNLREWLLSIYTTGIDAECALGTQLRAWKVHSIEFEIWIPDSYPITPPQVRVLKPQLSSGFYVHDQGALCLEILSAEGWTPAMSLLQLGVQMKAMMSQGRGTLNGTGLIGGTREGAARVSESIFNIHQDWKSIHLP